MLTALRPLLERARTHSVRLGKALGVRAVQVARLCHAPWCRRVSRALHHLHPELHKLDAYANMVKRGSFEASWFKA